MTQVQARRRALLEDGPAGSNAVAKQMKRSGRQLVRSHGTESQSFAAIPTEYVRGDRAEFENIEKGSGQTDDIANL